MTKYTPKFRAWHKKHERMYTDIDCIDFNGKQVGYLGVLFSFGDIELMQWTGFNDVKNWNIFEGDILAVDARQPVYLQEVFFERGAYMVSFNREVEAVWWYLDACIEKCPVNVIGNIYANPELLDPKDE